jgi:hypothetical protein
MFTEMKGKYGAFGGGATLEKSKLDLSQSTSRVSPQVSIPPLLPFFPFCLSGCGETLEGAFCSLATKLHASTFLKDCSQYVCQCLVQGINARIHHFFFCTLLSESLAFHLMSSRDSKASRSCCSFFFFFFSLYFRAFRCYISLQMLATEETSCSR